MKNNKLNTLYSRYVKIIFSRFNFWKFVGSYLIRFANCAQREVWLYFFPLGLNKWNSWWKDGYFFTNILSTFLQTHKHTYLLGKKIQKMERNMNADLESSSSNRLACLLFPYLLIKLVKSCAGLAPWILKDRSEFYKETRTKRNNRWEDFLIGEGREDGAEGRGVKRDGRARIQKA